ncbi:hypothetical protein RU87_GL001198 [Lactococcus plantarum]|uniref:Uncharacterized protein n=1 Tax=Pseudolactococcus plantarum TaxID=1365 RepID=A0A2A5S0Z5_9LACT|nr:hypothetical protein RU87_GL001198 [Lactococcus plantarum]
MVSGKRFFFLVSDTQANTGKNKEYQTQLESTPDTILIDKTE